MSTPLQGVWMSRDTRIAFREYAYLNRTSMAAVVRAAVDNINEQGAPESILSPDDDDNPSEVQLTVKVDHEPWDAAVAKMQAQGRSFNSVVRRYIRAALREEGLIT